MVAFAQHKSCFVILCIDFNKVVVLVVMPAISNGKITILDAEDYKYCEECS